MHKVGEGKKRLASYLFDFSSASAITRIRAEVYSIRPFKACPCHETDDSIDQSESAVRTTDESESSQLEDAIEERRRETLLYGWQCTSLHQ